MMMYKTTNLTQCLVAMTSKAQMLAHLADRERSVRSQLRKGLELGTQSEALEADMEELNLILALRNEITPQ